MANEQHGRTESFHSAECGDLNVVLGDPHCKRCGGLMVKEHCTDPFDETGRMEFPALRCLQCGNLVDAVILLNRLRGPAGVNHRRTKWNTQYRGTDSVH
jgi:predicted RNA-binding protein with PUA domain